MVEVLTLVAVAVGPADGSRGLSEEAPGLGLAVGVSAVAVVAQPSVGVLPHIVWELSPFQTQKPRVCLRHRAIIVPELCKALRAGQRA